MRRSTFMIALATVFAGGLAVLSAVVPLQPLMSGKSDRLSGKQMETAFLPERFGVPGSRQE